MIPQLAAKIGPRWNLFPCYLQPKLNGVRALYQNGIFQSRDEKLWKPDILWHLLEELEAMPKNIILDGELYVHGWRLQRINAAVAVNRTTATADSRLIEFHVYDSVDPNKTFKDRWFTQHWNLIQLDQPHIKVVDSVICENMRNVEDSFRHYVSLGYEGVMLRPDGPYVFGQTLHGTRKNSPYLWKKKQWEDGEYLCVGVTQGKGKASIGVGALTLTKDVDLHRDQLTRKWSVLDSCEFLHMNNPTFNVGTGFTDEDRITLFTNPPIGRLIRVRYPYLSATGIPQCPSFVCVMP